MLCFAYQNRPNRNRYPLPPADGSPSPFKPDKYYEASTYATLPTAQRVRALNFLCCVRADKEDIQVGVGLCCHALFKARV